MQDNHQLKFLQLLLLGVSTITFLTFFRLLVQLCYKTKRMFLFRCLVCLTGEDEEIVSPSVQEELNRGFYNPFSNFPCPKLLCPLPTMMLCPGPTPFQSAQAGGTRGQKEGRSWGPGPRVGVKPTPWLFMSNCDRREVEHGARAQPGQVRHLGSDFSCLPTVCVTGQFPNFSNFLT